MIGDKQGVYHSALVREGPVTVTITCDGPIASKYKGQPDFITFKHEGDAHRYVVENDQCGEALSGLKGQTVTIEATGGRDDADIIVTDADDAPPQQTRRPEKTKPAPRQERQHRDAEDGHHSPRSDRQEHQPAKKLTPEEKAQKQAVAFARMKVHGAKVAVALRASFLFAQKLFEDLGYKPGEDYAFEDLRAVAATHFIEARGSTDMSGLPSHWLAKETAPVTKQAPPPRQPEPEPDPEPEQEQEQEADEDIPF